MGAVESVLRERFVPPPMTKIEWPFWAYEAGLVDDVFHAFEFAYFQGVKDASIFMFLLGSICVLTLQFSGWLGYITVAAMAKKARGQ